MAYKITDSCLKCGTCAGECPMNAISEGEDQYCFFKSSGLGSEGGQTTSTGSN